MSVLNDIPKDLRDDRYSNDNWTPGRGLRKAAVAATLTVVVLSGVLAVAARWWPGGLQMWPLCAVFAFCSTCLIFSVAHRAAGMAGMGTFLIAGPAALLVSAVLVILRVGAIERMGTGVMNWEIYSAANIVFANLYVWVITACVSWLCKDGDNVLCEWLDMLNTNVFVGRR